MGKATSTTTITVDDRDRLHADPRCPYTLGAAYGTTLTHRQALDSGRACNCAYTLTTWVACDDFACGDCQNAAEHAGRGW